MQIVDTKGHLCPQPLIMARDALRRAAEGETMQIVSDNETSWQNLMSFLTDLGAHPVSKQEGDIYYIEVTNPGKLQEQSDANPEDYCEVPAVAGARNNYVVVVRSREMGEGNTELGNLLLRGYFNALNGMNNLPTHIIMYNTGVYHALKGTDIYETLVSLEDKGVNVIVCGTCVDFYQLKDRVGVGRISNMYQITGILAETGHVVYL